MRERTKQSFTVCMTGAADSAGLSWPGEFIFLFFFFTCMNDKVVMMNNGDDDGDSD